MLTINTSPMSYHSRRLLLAFSPDGTRVATRDATAVSLWNSITGERLIAVCSSTEGGGITGVAFNHDGKRITAACGNGRLLVWDTETGAKLHDIHLGIQLHALIPSHDSSRLAVIGQTAMSNVVWIVDSHTGKEQLRIDEAAHDVAFSSDGVTLILAYTDGNLGVWDLGGSERGRIRFGLGAHSVAFSLDGVTFASAGKNVDLWRLSEEGADHD